MSNESPSDAGTRLGSWPAPAQWLALVALSVLLAGGVVLAYFLRISRVRAANE